MEMLNGEPPFSKMNPLAAMYRIVTEEPVVPDGLSPELRVFMHRCWKKIPLKRATARELLRDPFLMLRHSSPVELSPERLIRVRLERLGDASLEKMASSISIHGANTPTKRSTDSEGHVGSTGSGTGVNTVPTVGYNFEQRLASLMDPAKDPFDFVFDALANDNGLITPDNLRHLICALGYHVSNGLAHVNG